MASSSSPAAASAAASAAAVPAVPAPVLVHEMQVVKRNGVKEVVNMQKITQRIRGLAKEPTQLAVDPIKVAQKVVENLFDGVSTRELDAVAARISAALALEHPDYADLAGRICVSDLHKSTVPNFYKTMKQLYDAVDVNGAHKPVISKELYEVARKHKKEIEEALDYDRDFLIDYFGYQTLTKSYLLHVRGTIVERPAHMWMRVALGIHGDDLDAAFETYHLMSTKAATHATPTLFNAGTPRPQMSSCYLLGMEDSLDGIFKSFADCSQLSKYAGGIGIHISAVRARGSPIYGTNGISDGIVPMLRCLNSQAKYINQCVTLDTLVHTSAGKLAAGSLAPNDRVLGSDGAYHPVTRVLEHAYTGQCLRLSANGQEVVATPEHPFLVYRSYKHGSGQPPKYLPACDVVEGDHLAIPVPPEQDVAHMSVDDCRMLGLLLTGGELTPTGGSVHKGRHDAFVRAYLESRYMSVSETSEELAWEYKAGFQRLPFTSAMLRGGLPAFCERLPAAKAAAILDGGLEHGILRSRVDGMTTLLVPVSSIESVQYDGYVYDVEVDGCEGFATSCGIVHGAAPDAAV